MTRYLLIACFTGVLATSLMAQGSTGTEVLTAPGDQASTPPASSAKLVESPALSFSIRGEEEITTEPVTLTSGSYAVFHTGEGDILVRLQAEHAPKTTENFVGLATGNKPWKHPVTTVEMRTPLYNNTVIHKTVENALIYGGDPINRGVGEPGYVLPLEISPALRFDQPGMLAMNLAGANSSGSRWFMTLRPLPEWSGRYTIFGKIIGGMDVARAISKKPTKRPTVPLDPVLVNSVEIVEVGPGKKTAATFTLEDGKRFVTIEKEYADDVKPPAPKPAPPAEETTPTVTGATDNRDKKK